MQIADFNRIDGVDLVEDSNDAIEFFLHTGEGLIQGSLFSVTTSVQWLNRKPLIKKYTGNPVKFHTDYLDTVIE